MLAKQAVMDMGMGMGMDMGTDMDMEVLERAATDTMRKLMNPAF